VVKEVVNNPRNVWVMLVLQLVRECGPALAMVTNKNAGRFTTKLSIWTYLSFLLTIPANRRATLVG
jgi:hypothetical protein